MLLVSGFERLVGQEKESSVVMEALLVALDVAGGMQSGGISAAVIDMSSFLLPLLSCAWSRSKM